ncbi:MAG: peptidoglycan DD-metalloendopeptidase family protein [Alphaproteobacteria bacterium]|jgi:septal ring factor EnvC (AmiA/AmiB activator)|nr:peptidoglycan DD-metalloendopeptidase family protein [Alphaproteobacteria bacterium]
MIRALLIALCCLANGAMAQDTAEAAQRAAQQLEAASLSLQEAGSGRDRISALTETVQAYEAGMAAMRDGLRRAAIRERSLTRDLNARSDEVAQLLGVLQRIEQAPTPLLLLHPSGPTGTARSGMMLADVTPGLQAKVDALRAQLEEVTILRQLQSDALATLEQGLAGAQEARSALSEAVSDRSDLPRRFSEDPVKTALLLASTETLDAFASSLAQIEAETGAASAPDATDLKGQLALPVDGTVLRGFGDADAAGIERPGILIATQPRALVTAPAAATIRYAGPLLDYGTVVILEPAQDVLWVFAGLAQVFGDTGQVQPEGAPIGLMGGDIGDAQAILTESRQGAASTRPESLYLEVREGQGAIDPATWFAYD